MGLSVGDRDIADIRYGDRLIEQVFAGPVEVWRRLHRWEQAGVSKTLTVPAWARYVDLVALGGGGGGTSGSGIAGGKGNGGVAGAFATRCWPVTPGQDITVTIGEPGQGGRDSADLAVGTAGGPTVITTPGNTFSAAGGRAGTGGGGGVGTSPGSVDYTPTRGTVRDTTTQSGGGAAGDNTDGQWPGGGGGPGTGGILGNRQRGRPGASGICWYRFRAY